MSEQEKKSSSTFKKNKTDPPIIPENCQIPFESNHQNQIPKPDLSQKYQKKKPQLSLPQKNEECNSFKRIKQLTKQNNDQPQKNN